MCTIVSTCVFVLYICARGGVQGHDMNKNSVLVCAPFLRPVSFCNPEPQRANEVQGKKRKNLVRVEKKTEIPCCGSCQLK